MLPEHQPTPPTFVKRANQFYKGYQKSMGLKHLDTRGQIIQIEGNDDPLVRCKNTHLRDVLWLDYLKICQGFSTLDRNTKLLCEQ